MNLFRAKYCNKYAMAGPIFKTGGFALICKISLIILTSNFYLQVFPKQSPLVPDISEAILYVTQSQKIMNIEKKWFKKERNCHEHLNTPKVSSSKLGSDSFWVLFLIAGLASVLSLIIFVASFIYRHRQIFMQQADTIPSTWRKIQSSRPCSKFSMTKT